MRASATLPGPILFGVHQGIISAQGDAAERKYRLLTGKSGKRWVVAEQDNAADNVYVDGGIGSKGFGGATLHFELVDGSIVSFIGPWKTTSDNLFSDTGHDVRATCRVQGIISLEMEYGKWPGPNEYREVLHFDETPQLREYGWLGQLAQSLADEIGRVVFYAQRSHGGGISGSCKPSVTTAKGNG